LNGRDPGVTAHAKIRFTTRTDLGIRTTDRPQAHAATIRRCLRSIGRAAEKKAIGRERKSGLLSAATIVPIVASLTNHGTARAAGFLPVLDLKIIDRQRRVCSGQAGIPLDSALSES
jgi:hypothetical protein